jgi:RHS repeat-associated protein
MSAMTLVNHGYNDSQCTGYSSDGGFWLPSIDIGDNAAVGQYIFQRSGPHGNNGAVTVAIDGNGNVSWSGDFGNVVGFAVAAYGNDWTWSVVQTPASGTASVTGEPVDTTPECTDPPNQPTNVYGTAYIQIGNALPPYDKCRDEKVGGDACTSCGQTGFASKGMARYSVHSMLASLHIEDTPIGHTPPRGPAIECTVSYNYREVQHSYDPTATNLGPRWNFNWVSYVIDNPANLAGDSSVYVRGGGVEIFSGYNSGTQSYAPDPQSHAILVRTQTSPITYEERFPDGSKQVFSHSDNSATNQRRVFLTEVWDSAGNKATIDFHDSSSLVVDSITDALGYKTTFTYDAPTHPFRIHQIKEPIEFGNRSALFEYDSSGRLQTITDTIGIKSIFNYSTDGTNFITSLQNPYGTTNFASGTTGVLGASSRWVEITDPLTGKERIEYKANSNISGSEPTAPAGMTNSSLHLGNTFYFDKKYHADHCSQNGCTYNYSQARITHWATKSDGSTTGIIASQKAPLENRVWYSYAGQSDTNHIGTTPSPSQIARILDDSTTQLWQYQYNSIGKMTQSIDPVGRKMNYDYDSNNIDLLTVRQTTGGANELLRTLTYNSLHEPLTDKDASGQTTQYFYRADGHGQIDHVVNAKGERTDYAYGDGSSGHPTDYLISVTGPTFNSTRPVTSYIYDNANRVHTVTNSPDNYSVTTDYDDLDRPVTITYPDATTQQFDYRKYANGTLVPPGVMTLDVGATKDRRGRWTYREYDSNRHVTKLIEPYGSNSTRTTIYNWCTCGSLESIVDARGKMTKLDRDLESRVITKTLAYGTSSASATSYGYENTTSRLKSMTDAKNQRTNYLYFADDNLNQVTYTDTNGQPLNPATASVTFGYDPNYNRVTWMADGTGTTSYGYYPVTSPAQLGATQLQTVDGPLTNDTITYSYDELGRAVNQSINGVSSSVAYDSLGRLSTSDNPLGHFTRAYESDVTPRLKTLTFPTGQTSNYAYFDNSHDRRLQTLQDLTSGSVNLSKFDYTYDPDGQIYPTWIKQLSTSPATTMNLTYDSGDQLTQVVNTTPNNPSTTFGYGYDSASNRTSDSNATYGINDLNEITNSGYTYDADGNQTSDGVNTYEWDAANRLTAVIYPSSSGRTDFTYDGLGRRVKIVEKDTYGSAYDSRNFIWSGMTIAEERFDNGTVRKRFLAEGVQLPTGSTPNMKLYYSKDHLGSIRSLTNENGTIVGTLDYDAFGGISRAPVPANDTSGSGPVLLSAVSRMTQGDAGTFDLNLPLSGAPGIEMRGGTSYTIVLTFDRNVSAATSTTLAAGIGTVGSTTFSGNTATVSLTDVSDRQTITVELDNVVGAVGVNSKVLVSMSVLVCDVDQSGSVTSTDVALTAANSGHLLDSTTFKYDTTHNGAISSGDITFANMRETGTLYPDFAFTGHFYHARSGLYLAPYRAYNPTIGRWLSRDPIEEDGGLNLYLYVLDNPIGLKDPLGLKCEGEVFMGHMSTPSGAATDWANRQKQQNPVPCFYLTCGGDAYNIAQGFTPGVGCPTCNTVYGTYHGRTGWWYGPDNTAKDMDDAAAAVAKKVCNDKCSSCSEVTVRLRCEAKWMFQAVNIFGLDVSRCNTVKKIKCGAK